MPNAAGKRAFRKRSGFKPNQRLLWSRFGKRWSKGFPWEWYWRMRVMGRARSSARTSPNSDCNMQWALSRTPPSGNRDNRPLPAPARKPGRGAPPKRLQRNADHQPISVKQLALGLPSSAWKEIGWRQGSEEICALGSPPVRVRPAHRDYKRTEPYPEEWLLIEWPKKESEPYEILAIHAAGEDLIEVSGEDHQTPLDHRTRLRGTQAGIGIRPL